MKAKLLKLDGLCRVDSHMLTVGKVYEVRRVNGYVDVIEADDGHVVLGLYPERFEFLDEVPANQNAARRTHTLPQDSAARKSYPLYRGLVRYFPAALAAIANLSKIGNDKHNPGEEMHHARGKSNDHRDCELRHLMDMDEDFGKGKGRDENGTPQVVMKAWRALADCQEWLEENDGAPLAPGAKLPPGSQ